MKAISTIILSLAFATTSYGQGMSAEDKAALQQVQKMLTNPAQRQQAINTTSDARSAHQNALNTVGADNIDELYAVSAIVMEDLVRISGGDPAKMQQIMLKAQQDPEAFFKMLSPQSVQKIKALAKKSGNKS